MYGWAWSEWGSILRPSILNAARFPKSWNGWHVLQWLLRIKQKFHHSSYDVECRRKFYLYQTYSPRDHGTTSRPKRERHHSFLWRFWEASEALFVPSQLLVPVIRGSRKKAINVIEITATMVWDWQKLAQNLKFGLRILRVRTSELGEAVKWPKMTQIEFSKGHTLKISFKTNHLASNECTSFVGCEICGPYFIVHRTDPCHQSPWPSTVLFRTWTPITYMCSIFFTCCL